MNKTKFKYVKYSKRELDRYVRDKNSCITLTNSEMHVGFPPWGFANFQETLTNIVSRDKIGKYDAKLDGIVLEVRNIKVFGTAYPVHDDDPYNHINIKANFYVFQPRIGETIKGVVKHISNFHVAVIIYRVFNVSIRFKRTDVQDSLKINQPISFRVKKFDLQGAMPYIEGELIEINCRHEPRVSKKHLKFENDEDTMMNSLENGIITKRKCTPIGLRTEVSSSSDEEGSDTGKNESQNDRLINGLFPNVEVKQEKISDSEEETRTKYPAYNENKHDEFSDSDESETGENDHISGSIARVKQENVSSECSSGSERSEDESAEPPETLHKVEKEKRVELPTKSKTFIPRPIKIEPQSDVERESNFKKPSTKARDSVNAIRMSGESRKRKRESSMSEQLDSLVDNLMNTTKSEKQKRFMSCGSNEDLGDLSLFQTPNLSSTLKIKQEPQSEDEMVKRKNGRKSSGETKTLKSRENDLFNSFLK